MATVSIFPISEDQGNRSFIAVAGDRQSAGRTVGEALDAITAQFGEEQEGTLVVVQHYRPDRFFTAKQLSRLQELMNRWRAARDVGQTLSAAEQSELDALVEAEVRAAADRAAALADELAI
jgi:cysteinyl-tRNA synthetase